MEPNVNPPIEKVIRSLSETLITENIEIRGSLSQINSILKHAVELLNESIVEAHDAQYASNSVSLFNVISKSTKLIQAEDIISQITARLRTRSLEIDNALMELNKLSENDPSLQTVLIQIKLIKNHSANPITQHNLNDGESEIF